jgi:hypothetical protein
VRHFQGHGEEKLIELAAKMGPRSDPLRPEHIRGTSPIGAPTMRGRTIRKMKCLTYIRDNLSDLTPSFHPSSDNESPGLI